MNQHVSRRAFSITSAGVAAGLVNVAASAAAPAERDIAQTLSGISPRIAVLEKAFKKAWSEYRAYLPVHNTAERALIDGRPTRPNFEEEWPDDLRERFLAVPVGRVSDRTHPVSAETMAISERNAASRKEWEAECAAHEEQIGWNAIDEQHQDLLDGYCVAARAVMSCPANSVADLAVKARVHKKYFFTEQEDIDTLFRDAARIYRQARKAVQS